ncbi:MAG: penicillin-insensitive murein endopeptidase, partial [Rhizobiales bacterium]|nr:penicillin-insensitive murein endopeptidase [Hyphomicrobiales bacterium]
MRFLSLIVLAMLAPAAALAQNPAPNAPAKELFGRKTDAAPLAARAIGFYSKGCLAGGIALPVNGKTWQVMRLSRNRNWGHPDLIAFLERFANKVPKVAGWRGILVGDLAQPRGGP